MSRPTNRGPSRNGWATGPAQTGVVAEPWALAFDPGIDDAVALATLVGLGTVPDLVVSVPGNVGGAVAARNAAGLVALLGLDVPVRSFRRTDPAAVRPGRGPRHGDDGLGGVAHLLPESPVPEPLGADDLPGAVLVTGSLACVGEALAAGRTFDRIWWMGGSLGDGNVTVEAEFNAWCAPEAADAVLSEQGLVTRVVPLGVTGRVVLDPDDLGGGATGSVLADALSVRRSAPVHDAVAAVARTHPQLFGWADLALRCEVAGAGRGRLAANGPGPTAVAVEVDVPAVLAVIVAGVRACP